MTDVGTDFYLRVHSGGGGARAGPINPALWFCWPDILLCIGVEGPEGEGLEPGKSLILLRQRIRCPEIIRGYVGRGLGGREEAV